MKILLSLVSDNRKFVARVAASSTLRRPAYIAVVLVEAINIHALPFTRPSSLYSTALTFYCAILLYLRTAMQHVR